MRPDKDSPPRHIPDNSRKGIVVAPVGLPPIISLATKQLKIFPWSEHHRLGRHRAPVFRTM